jgi:aminoglycoside 3-N-acetyltransferase
MIHGDAGVLAQFSTDLTDMSEVVDEVLDFFSKDGTVIVPTFTYSATKSVLFDPQQTPGEVGRFSEVFRLNGRTFRTSHPNFSVSVFGKRADEILGLSLTDAFGPNTLFHFLEVANANLVTMGCSLNALTFTHFVEQQVEVPYRFMKSFRAVVRDQRSIREFETTYFVRNLDFGQDTSIELKKFRERSFELKELRSSHLGRFECTAIKASNCALIMRSMLDEDVLSLVKAGNR